MYIKIEFEHLQSYNNHIHNIQVSSTEIRKDVDTNRTANRTTVVFNVSKRKKF